MKIIQLIRHAKSSWEAAHLTDQQRPLNHKGSKDCAVMARALHAAGIKLHPVYCSTAQRAQLTIQGIAEHWPAASLGCSAVPLNWQLSDALYTFSSTQLWQFIHALDDEIDEVCLVGHNPAFTDLINTSQSKPEHLANFPTCGFAELTFAAATWDQLCPGGAQLVQFFKPKMFR